MCLSKKPWSNCVTCGSCMQFPWVYRMGWMKIFDFVRPCLILHSEESCTRFWWCFWSNKPWKISYLWSCLLEYRKAKILWVTSLPWRQQTLHWTYYSSLWSTIFIHGQEPWRKGKKFLPALKPFTCNGCQTGTTKLERLHCKPKRCTFGLLELWKSSCHF